MDKLSIIKGVAGMITGASVGKTVDIILKNNLPIEMNWKTRLATIIGSAAISGYISAKCGDYVEDEIDKVAEFVGVVKKTVDENKDIIIDNTDYHPSEIMEVFPPEDHPEMYGVEMTD